jgi:copper chaperone CopZ
MNRRNFLNRTMGATAGLGLAGAGALAISKLAETRPRENQTTTYKVQGFTCITCATGLEVMLMEQPGVARARASYPDASVAIGFDKNLTTEAALREFIASCGFSVA